MKVLLVTILASTLLAAPPARIISSGSTRAKVVALTFDAGADRGFAAQILKTLERNHIRASFGMTGRWAEQNPDLVRRMARDQDILINHTYDHRSFTGLSSGAPPLSLQQRTWEIQHADAIIKRLTGHSTKPYFRPPFGDYDPAMLALLPHLGYTYSIMWTVDSGGWQRIPATSILIRCLTGARPGAIFLMHVGSQSQDATALPRLITDLKRQGYRFVTVPQVVALK
jgi:peptidoglycan/xylan/chitin deacetylase (PgdA/CDA1 family)